MNGSRPTRLDIIAAIGLAVGGAFGLGGSFVGQPSVRQVLWAVDAAGIIVATSLMTLKYFRKGDDCVAAGFLVFVAAEALVVSNSAAGLSASTPSFGAGIMLWSVSLLMTSLPKIFPLWGRVAGIVAALLFTTTAVRIFWGEQLLANATPLPSAGYPFLVLAFVGWIVHLLKPASKVSPPE